MLRNAVENTSDNAVENLSDSNGVTQNALERAGFRWCGSGAFVQRIGARLRRPALTFLVESLLTAGLALSAFLA